MTTIHVIFVGENPCYDEDTGDLALFNSYAHAIAEARKISRAFPAQPVYVYKMAVSVLTPIGNPEVTVHDE